MIENLEQLYFNQLRDLVSAETQLLQALPEMANDATHEELREAFEHHLLETRGQIARLEKIAATHGENLSGGDCPAMRGLIKEARRDVDRTLSGNVRDAVLIAAANRVEHYEIAAYGAARTFAKTLGFMSDAKLLDDSLDEEGAADNKITRIAMGGIFHPGVNEAAVL